jgi:hypothetical protein
MIGETDSAGGGDMSCVEETVAPGIDIDLPEAPPDLYLAWTKWRRRYHRCLLASLRASPGLRQSIRSVHGPLALVWALFSQDIKEQALSARGAGLGYVAPRLRANVKMLPPAIVYLDEPLRWTRSLEVKGARAGRRPAGDVLALQARVLAAIQREFLLHCGRSAIRLLSPAHLPLAS